MEISKQGIVDYYDSCETDYQFFWDLDKSLAMHAGYWDETTKTLPEALAKENEILSRLADIKTSDSILDAGCGVGGSSIYLANTFNCHVVGISLSANQVEKARRYAFKRCSRSMPTFEVMDFTATSFPDASFDVVWAIESVCHASDKKAFLQEAFRLLKPRGRLIVADGFLSKPHYTSIELKKMDQWLNGWGVNYLASISSFKDGIENAGFENISFQDITKNVLPSSRKLYKISFPAFLLSKVGQYLGLRTKAQTDNIKAAYYQYITLKKSLWSYGIFSALKK